MSVRCIKDKAMKNATVRRFESGDAAAVSALVIETMRTSNTKDYGAAFIEQTVEHFGPESILKKAGWTHFYVVTDGEKIVGCGAIGPYWDKEDESCLFTIFVHPACQGRGIGRLIIQTLEEDEYFLRAKRIEVPASITALGFYKKMGYAHKGGVVQLDDEQHYPMEKFR